MLLPAQGPTPARGSSIRCTATRRESMLALGGGAALLSSGAMPLLAPTTSGGAAHAAAAPSAYDFALPQYGESVPLAGRFGGKVIVLVNIASQ